MSAHEPPEAYYLIGIVAELAGMHPQTLRLYERRGLLRPYRTAGKTRRYSDEDLAVLRRIQELSEEGLNLAGIERVLGLERTIAEVEAHLAELTQQLSNERQMHREELAQTRRSMRSEVVLVTRTETALVPIRHTMNRDRGR